MKSTSCTGWGRRRDEIEIKTLRRPLSCLDDGVYCRASFDGYLLAFTDKAGNFTLENLSGLGTVYLCLCPQPAACCNCYGDLSDSCVSAQFHALETADKQTANHADAGNAADVDELSASDLCVDDFA